MKLTCNFHLNEFLAAGDTMPGYAEIQNLKLLANRLQAIRDLLYSPIYINSGYRSKAHNETVGGKPDSYHLLGMAADIRIDGLTPAEVQEALKDWSGGLGSYETFTHVDIRDYKARW